MIRTVFVLAVCLVAFTHSIAKAQPPLHWQTETDIDRANMGHYLNSTFHWGNDAPSWREPSLVYDDSLVAFKGVRFAFTYVNHSFYFPGFEPKIRIEVERFGTTGNWETVDGFPREIAVDPFVTTYRIEWFAADAMPFVNASMPEENVRYRLKITTPDGAVRFFYFYY